MLGSLHGWVQGSLGQRILIEVNGVGYWVYTGAWQPVGEVTCFLHHHVREDSNELFGFANLESLELFEQLISVSGVGPKVGLAILSLGESARIAYAIEHADAAFLTLAPGVGKKAAEKIILELQHKVRSDLSEVGQLQKDLLAALEGLGYKAADVREWVANVPAEHATLDAQIRWVLRQMQS